MFGYRCGGASVIPSEAKAEALDGRFCSSICVECLAGVVAGDRELACRGPARRAQQAQGVVVIALPVVRFSSLLLSKVK